ncbi:hypothetical protein [Candidatus Nanohalovita haloferacivicina]|uniref:hypothetical protein n=1 Tax=Candidatus Nanohalovita haloferacivicina TaxID=2978046 RepID=UPI00325FA0A5|nr:hypothetical protein HBNXNv_0512 [Candidatus Nanohalobia archaeon BNXNv]
MRFLDNIQDNITDESAAYGYTLSIWGSGALLLNNFTMTPSAILAFVFGGVVGFALLAAISFRGFFREVESPEVQHIAASMIHIFASLGSVLITYLAVTNVESFSMAFVFLIGAHVTFTYNILLVFEELISEDIYRLERK